MPDQPQPPAPQPTLTIKKFDRPELAETFADSIDNIAFDGQSMRIEFCITRMDQPQTQGAAPSARRYPACRIVLTPGAAVELMNQIQRVTAGLIKAGVLKQTMPPESNGKDAKSKLK